jgi:hypothetical protein
MKEDLPLVVAKRGKIAVVGPVEELFAGILVGLAGLR